MRLTEIILEANVRNTADIDHYLSQFAQQVRAAPAKEFLTKNVKRWIVNNDQALAPTKQVTSSDPAWAHKAFEDGLLYDFVGSPELSDRLQHIVDAIKEIAADQPELLERFASLSLDGVENLVDAFYKKRMGTSVATLGQGETSVIDYRDGARWVQITTPQALAIEGNTMGHCVGSYGRHMDDPGAAFFSYRDSRNKAHITIYAVGKSLKEVKGKQNQAPVSKYMPRVLDFLNKLHFEYSCADLEKYDVVRNGSVWSMFDPENVQAHHCDDGHGGKVEVRFIKHSAYVRFANSTQDIKIMNYRSMPYDPSIPLAVYAYIVRAHGGVVDSYRFDRECLLDHSDELEAITRELTAMEPKAKWRYLRQKGVEYVVRDKRPDGTGRYAKALYFIREADGTIHESSNAYMNVLPMESKMVLAIKLGYPMDNTERLTLLGKMSPAKAAEMSKKLKVDHSSSTSFHFSDPLMKHLPENLKVPNTLFIGPHCGLRKLPNGLKVQRDLNLRDTPIVQIGENTHVKRNMRLGGSAVTKLPKGLVIGGGSELKGCLDLRGSLIKSVPDDLQLLRQPNKITTYGRHMGGAQSRIIIEPGQKVRIPKHLQQFVEEKKYAIEQDPEDETKFISNSPNIVINQ